MRFSLSALEKCKWKLITEIKKYTISLNPLWNQKDSNKITATKIMRFLNWINFCIFFISCACFFLYFMIYVSIFFKTILTFKIFYVVVRKKLELDKLTDTFFCRLETLFDFSLKLLPVRKNGISIEGKGSLN